MLYPVELRGRRDSMRPRNPAIESEVIRISLDDSARFFRLNELERDAVLGGVVDRLRRRLEGEPHLAVRIAGLGPAHEGVGNPGLRGLELKRPELGLGLARLHGGLGGAKD